MGATGIGSIAASYGLAKLKDRFDADQLSPQSEHARHNRRQRDVRRRRGPVLAFAASI